MHAILKKLTITLPALLVAATLVTVVPAFAVEAELSDDSTQTTTTESGHGHKGKHVAHTSDDATAKRDAAKLKRCEGKKNGVERRFTNIVSKSQKIQDKITTIYGRGTTYVTNKNLTPANYVTLVAAADAAKAKSQSSIDALKAATPTIDCTNTDIAGSVDSFKTASKQVKTDLKAYRTAVKAVFVSVRAAAQAAKPDSDDGPVDTADDKTTTTTPAGGTQ